MNSITLSVNGKLATFNVASHSDLLQIVESRIRARLIYVLRPTDVDEIQRSADFPSGTDFILLTYDTFSDVTSKQTEGVTSKQTEGVTSKQTEGVTSKQTEGVTSKQNDATSKLSLPSGGELVRPKAPKFIPERKIPSQFKYRKKKLRPGEKSFNDEVYSFTCRIATDHLNLMFHNEGSRLQKSQAELVEYLFGILESNFKISNQFDFDGPRTTSTLMDEDAEKLADRAAAYALAGWDPFYFSKKEMAGRIGGKISRPIRKVTSRDLARTAEMTAVQAARALGVDKRTIQRRRAEATKNRPRFE